MADVTVTRLGVDSETIAKFLKTVKVGELVTYEAISKLINRNVAVEGRSAMDSARRALLRDGIRFDAVRGEGIKRLSDSEIAKSGSASIRAVRRKVNREVRKNVVSDYKSLTNEERIAHNTTLSVLGTMLHFTKSEQVKAVEARVTETSQRLEIADSVDAISRALAPKK